MKEKKQYESPELLELSNELFNLVHGGEMPDPFAKDDSKDGDRN